MKLSLFSQPQAESATLQHDSGWSTPGYKDIFKGRPCTSFDVPNNSPNGHGCSVIFHHSGKVDIKIRGILYLRDGFLSYPWADPSQTAALEQDDFYFQDEIVCPEPIPDPDPIPAPGNDPLSIIQFAHNTYPNHEDRVEMLKLAAVELNRANIDSGGRGPFGILRKQTGNNCGGYSCDIIAAGQGNDQGQWDVLINDSIPAWNGPNTIIDGIRVDICEPQLP